MDGGSATTAEQRRGGLPGPSLRAIYLTKVFALLTMMGVLAVLRLFVSPGVPAVPITGLILFDLIPTVAVIAQRGEVSRTLIGLCFAADVLGVTGAVHYGGGVDNTSGPIIYVLIIALAGLMLSARATYYTAAGCAACYALVALGEGLGILAHHYEYARPTPAAIGTVIALDTNLFLAAVVVAYATRELRVLHRRAEQLRSEMFGARTVTLVFGSDIESVSAASYWDGDAEAHQLVQTRNALVRAQVAAHDGTCVELRSDGFVLAFPRPDAAVKCAVGIQQVFRDHAHQHPNQRLMARIGIHTGEALRAGEQFFGKAVILASRIAALAGVGEIVVSAGLRERAGGVSGVRFGDGKIVRLKGLAGEYTVHPVRVSS